jgi:hypothetical protein
MTPLFATQASQSMMEVDDTVDGVRATQDVQQFTQTQDPGNASTTKLFCSLLSYMIFKTKDSNVNALLFSLLRCVEKITDSGKDKFCKYL